MAQRDAKWVSSILKRGQTTFPAGQKTPIFFVGNIVCFTVHVGWYATGQKIVTIRETVGTFFPSLPYRETAHSTKMILLVLSVTVLFLRRLNRESPVCSWSRTYYPPINPASRYVISDWNLFVCPTLTHPSTLRHLPTL